MNYKAIGVSVRFELRGEKRGYVFDKENNEWLDLKESRTKIAIYESRVKGWFFKPIRELAKIPDTGYVRLALAISQIEGNQQFRNGCESEGKSKDMFSDAMARIFALPRGAAQNLYRTVRCGLFHDGFTKGKVVIADDFAFAIEEADGRIQISPALFCDAVEQDFDTYCSGLRSGADSNGCAQFEKMFDDAWRASKGELESLL